MSIEIPPHPSREDLRQGVVACGGGFENGMRVCLDLRPVGGLVLEMRVQKLTPRCVVCRIHAGTADALCPKVVFMARFALTAADRTMRGGNVERGALCTGKHRQFPEPFLDWI